MKSSLRFVFLRRVRALALGATACTCAAYLLNVHPLLTALLAHVVPWALAGGLFVLTWSLARRWRLGMLVVALMVAGMAIHVTAWSSATPGSGAGDITLLTFNVAARWEERQLIEVWLAAQAADVVLLQETYPAHDGLFAPESAAYPHVRVQTTPLDYRGLSILSRFPIISAEGFDGEQAYTRAEVLLPDGRAIAIYNVSLAAPFADTAQAEDGLLSLVRDYAPAERNRQIKRLLRRLRADPLPVILGGDFNLIEYEAPYAWLTGFPLVDGYRAGERAIGATFPSGVESVWLGALPPLFRIDYVWHSPDFTTLARQVGPVLYSDHLPLRVSLALGGEG